MVKGGLGLNRKIFPLHHCGDNSVQVIIHMGSFPHPTHYFAAAGENDDFVIAAFNFKLNQSL